MPNTVTVGSFTGTWKSRRTNPYSACLYFGEETRCGMRRHRGDVLVRPAKWAVRCANCSNVAYCPDCGDTAANGHAAGCCYGGER